MPLHSVPLSRRRFVQGAALAGVGLLLSRDFLLAGEGVDDSRWALFSDTHIDANADLVFREVHLADHLRSCVQQVAALEKKPTGVFINGDCARSDGQSGDYATLTSLLKPLAETGLPVHMTLGNHDHRERFWNTLKTDAATRPFQSKHATLIESKHANWILLDSLDKTNVTPGLLEKEQREWLAKTLDARPNKPVLVMLHHQPHFGDPAKNSGLLDTTELLEVLSPRKQVKALIFGHTHVWDFKEKNGIHLINLPAVAYSFSPTQPTGWVDCLLQKEGAVFELRAHDEKHPKHGKKIELVWRT